METKLERATQGELLLLTSTTERALFPFDRVGNPATINDSNHLQPKQGHQPRSLTPPAVRQEAK